jgi:hypothetical protein
MVTTVYSYNHEIFKESKTASQTLKLSAPERFVIFETIDRQGL